ncbi:MAG: hypothetical protein M3N08_04075 [Pseudomonadota bacterium]|nr:hypothetical protein [Pseudomonadota bacterium]
MHCEHRKRAWICAYSHGGPLPDCTGSVRVSVSAIFPAGVPIVADMQAEAVATPTTDYVPGGSCYAVE